MAKQDKCNANIVQGRAFFFTEVPTDNMGQNPCHIDFFFSFLYYCGSRLGIAKMDWIARKWKHRAPKVGLVAIEIKDPLDVSRPCDGIQLNTGIGWSQEVVQFEWCRTAFLPEGTATLAVIFVCRNNGLH